MNLVPLYEEAIQFNNFNGTVLAAGKVEVWYLGRTRKADIYADVAGETPIPNPLDLNDLGMQEVYVNPAFNYTLVVYDPYGAELFSVDKYLQGAGDHTTSNVVVQPSEHIGVSAWTVGEVQIYQPYLVGEVGKTYEGISPIVVNNVEDKISAQHVPLGVQDPLYFVQDDEEGCIIGCSAQTEIPSAISGKWDAASDTVITNSAQWAENTEYEAGNYISIDNNVINVTGLSPVPTDTASTGLVAEVSADIVSQIPSTAGLATESWVEGKNYATVSQLDNKLDKADSAKFYPMTGNPSGFLTAHQSLNGYATEQWVEDKGYLTGIDIPESANWNSTYNTVHDNSASWTGGSTPNPQIPVTGINGIKISESGDQVVFEVSGDYYTNDNPSGFITGVDLSDYATTAQLAEKQDISGMTAYQPVGNYQTAGDYLTTADSANFYTTANESGFITGVDLTPYQTTAGMTAYQPVGDYLTTADSANFYTTANESGFITGVDLTPYQLTADMTAYQSAGDYLTTADSANFYTTANESGYITGVPDTYLQNTDLTISDGKITEISGVPLSAGDELPESVSAATDYVTANSATINGTVETVSSNSGVWGGSALPVSAGPGIKVNLVDNTLVFSNDETVLFEGDALHNNATATLSESFTNFEKIKVYGHTDDGIMYPWFTEVPTFSGIGFIGVATNNAGWSKWFGLSVPDTTHIVPHTGYVSTWASTSTAYLSNTWGITRVIGVNRTAGGN